MKSSTLLLKVQRTACLLTPTADRWLQWCNCHSLFLTLSCLLITIRKVKFGGWVAAGWWKDYYCPWGNGTVALLPWWHLHANTRRGALTDTVVATKNLMAATMFAMFCHFMIYLIHQILHPFFQPTFYWNVTSTQVVPLEVTHYIATLHSHHVRLSNSIQPLIRKAKYMLSSFCPCYLVTTSGTHHSVGHLLHILLIPNFGRFLHFIVIKRSNIGFLISFCG